MLKLVDAGEGDHKIIAIPPEADEQVIKVEKWKDFEDDFFRGVRLSQKKVGIPYKILRFLNFPKKIF